MLDRTGSLWSVDLLWSVVDHCGVWWIVVDCFGVWWNVERVGSWWSVVGRCRVWWIMVEWSVVNHWWVWLSVVDRCEAWWVVLERGGSWLNLVVWSGVRWSKVAQWVFNGKLSFKKAKNKQYNTRRVFR